jgi:hypothetical protein
MTETERDVEERIRAILGVTGAPLDVSTRILELIEWGDIVRVEAPGGIEGLRALAYAYRQRLDQLRERFLRELLIERRSVGACVARFFLSVKELLEEMTKQLGQMGIVYSESAQQRTLRVLQKWTQEGDPFLEQLRHMVLELTDQKKET